MVHLIDGPGSVGGSFVPIDVATGQQPTQATIAWLESHNRELVNAVQGAGITPDKANNSQLLQAIQAIAGAPPKNLIVNGLFRLWQRTGTASPSQVVTEPDGIVYVPDRFAFQAGTGGSPSMTVSREAMPDDEFPPGTEVRGHFPYFCRVDQTVAATTTSPDFLQRIEDVRTLSGSIVVVSANIRIPSSSPTALVNVTPRLVQHFGTGGSPSAFVTYQGPAWPVTGETWQRWKWTVSLGSLLGKTLGTDGNSRLALHLEFLPLNQAHTVDIVDVRVEPGTAVGTDYPTFAQDLLACRRYYQKSFRIEDPPGHGSGSIEGVWKHAGDIIGLNLWNSTFPLPVAMFRVADFYCYHPTDASPTEEGTRGSLRVGDGGGEFAADEGVSGITGTREQFGPIVPLSWGQSPTWINFHWTADAEIV